MKWLKATKPSQTLVLLSLGGGNLKKEFLNLVDAYYQIEKVEGTSISKFYQFLNNHKKQKIIQKLVKSEFDLIYANTVLSLPISETVQKRSKNSKLILHVHELNAAIKILLPDLGRYKKKIDGVIACSEMVKELLITQYEFAKSKVEVVYSYSSFSIQNKEKSAVKDKFIVGGAGVVGWRKGTDLFIQTAYYIKKNYKEFQDIEFRWIGKISLEEKIVAEEDLRKCDIGDMVVFTGELQNPLREYEALNVFLIPSREDPFPLVGIEVGQLKTPIICFDRGTGIVEPLRKGGGKIVSYLNVAEMAEKVINYYNDRVACAEDGEKAHEIFSEYTLEKKAEEIYEYLKRVSSY